MVRLIAEMPSVWYMNCILRVGRVYGCGRIPAFGLRGDETGILKKLFAGAGTAPCIDGWEREAEWKGCL